MEPTIATLTAGLVLRYSGLKQLEAIGGHGRTMMDYSIGNKKLDVDFAVNTTESRLNCRTYKNAIWKN